MVFPARTQASKDTPRQDERVPSYGGSIQGCPSKKERRREEQGKRERERGRERGKSEREREREREGKKRLVTLCHAKIAGSLDHYGHLMACSSAAYSNAILGQVLANNFSGSLLRSLRAILFPSNGNVDKAPATANTPRVHPGL